MTSNKWKLLLKLNFFGLFSNPFEEISVQISHNTDFDVIIEQQITVSQVLRSIQTDEVHRRMHSTQCSIK